MYREMGFKKYGGYREVMCAGVYTTWCNRLVPTFLGKRVASVFKVKKNNKVLLP